jgi:hypothetical protein
MNVIIDECTNVILNRLYWYISGLLNKSMLSVDIAEYLDKDHKTDCGPSYKFYTRTGVVVDTIDDTKSFKLIMKNRSKSIDKTLNIRFTNSFHGKHCHIDIKYTGDFKHKLIRKFITKFSIDMNEFFKWYVTVEIGIEKALKNNYNIGYSYYRRYVKLSKCKNLHDLFIINKDYTYLYTIISGNGMVTQEKLFIDDGAL